MRDKIQQLCSIKFGFERIVKHELMLKVIFDSPTMKAKRRRSKLFCDSRNTSIPRLNSGASYREADFPSLYVSLILAYSTDQVRYYKEGDKY